MTSKDHILKAVRQNRPELAPQPDLPLFDVAPATRLTQFLQLIEQVGAEALLIPEPEQWGTVIQERYASARKFAHNISPLKLDSVAWANIDDPHQLAAIEVAIIEGELGVAENGAIWIPETALPHRVLPFIAQHLVVLLDQNKLVSNMHEAYQQLGTALPDFGMFLSGPSKTADIEQAMVKGAHGARSLLVLLY